MTELFGGRNFKLGVAAPSAIWLLIWGSYISIYIGWENLFYLLPHEVAGTLFAFVLPIILLLGAFLGLTFVTLASDSNDSIAEEIRRQDQAREQAKETILGKLDRNAENDQATRSTLLSRMDKVDAGYFETAQLINGNGDVLKALATALSSRLDKVDAGYSANAQLISGNGDVLKALASALNSHHGEIRSLDQRVDALIQNLYEATTDPARAISQQTSLMGMIDIILSDTSVSTTRLLVGLLENNGHPKTDIIQLVQGLMNAYSVGEKGIFMTVLSQQLTNGPQDAKPLRLMADASPAISHDISKVMRANQDIEIAISQCADASLVRIAMDNTPLKTLAGQLAENFNPDGYAKSETTPEITPETTNVEMGAKGENDSSSEEG